MRYYYVTTILPLLPRRSDHERPQALYRFRPKVAFIDGGPFNKDCTSTLTDCVFNTDLAASFAAFAIRIASDAVVSAYSGHLAHLA
jgi:hypothetical protein